MTERLYYADSWLTEFDAAVVDTADDGLRAYLDRTAFYPTSGGQPFDTGTLGESAVVDVVDEGERIAHVLATPIRADGRVHGMVDWDRRFDHMQQHTGQHVLSAVFEDLFGHATVSVHFGADYSTLDLDVPAVEAAKVAEAEARANEIVLANRPVGVFFAEAGAVSGLRKPPPDRGLLRVVEISGIDRSACGGTHVRSTAQIGPILLGKLDRVRQSARIEFVCGRRALRRARADFDAISAIARTLSASPAEAPALVSAQAERLAEADRLRRRISAELQANRARELLASAAPSEDGLRRVLHRDATGDAEAVRTLAQEFSRLSRGVLVILLEGTNGVVVASTEDSGVDAAALLRAALEGTGGRGGGSARVAQGRAPSAEALEEGARRLMP